MVSCSLQPCYTTLPKSSCFLRNSLHTVYLITNYLVEVTECVGRISNKCLLVKISVRQQSVQANSNIIVYIIRTKNILFGRYEAVFPSYIENHITFYIAILHIYEVSFGDSLTVSFTRNRFIHLINVTIKIYD